MTSRLIADRGESRLSRSGGRDTERARERGLERRG